MTETALTIGMFTAIMGFITIILKVLLSMNTKITENTMNIRFIKQMIGVNSPGCNKKKDKEVK